MNENKAYLNGVEIGTVEDFNVFVKGVNEMSEQNVKTTQKAYFDKFVALYHEQATIASDIKQLTDEFKEDYAEADITNLKVVAKLHSEQAVGDKVEKMNKLQEVIDTFA